MRTLGRLTGLGTLAALFSALAGTTHGLNFTRAPAPNLDFSQLGRVAVVGDFDSISIYEYEGQNQEGYSTNGSQALLGRYPSGEFGIAAASDGNIESMCPFVMRDGSLAGIVVGGNFTSLGGVETQGVALFNPNTSEITPLPGITGRVSSIYCDAQSATVYVGGAFTGANSTNAIAWVTGWTNLPFAGFNGPVRSITKAPNGNIIFGGDFDGLGNATTPQERNNQAINIGSADVRAGSTSTTPGFTDPRNIVCKDFTQQGSSQTWLLADNSPGYWNAKFGFGFNPTLLRLWNTNYEGRGTKTFRMTALPNGGIMNLTFVDESGSRRYCDATCPLPQGNTTAQDYQLVNSIGMNEVRIDISEWYGNGGGLNGIQLLQDDLYTFAVSSFNEPQCGSSTSGAANATSTGPWQQTPSGQSVSDYLTAYINSGTVDTNTAQVVFQPNIKQSGNYSITMYTPGCIQDNSCTTRGTANVTGRVSSDGPQISTTVTQTNDFDKYDQIYYGYVDVTEGGFRPQVTIAPQAGQNIPLTLVAQRIRFELVNSTGGLNGLFEYNPNQATVNTDFSASAINRAGMAVSMGAVINGLAVVDQNLYVGGNFTSNGGSSSGINNIFSVSGNNATSLPGSGLNNAIETIYQNGSTLYIGGNFTNTADNNVEGLVGVAAFSVSDNQWRPLGAGVNGTVSNIVPLQINVTSGNLQDAIAVSGQFSTVNGFGQNASFAADGIAIWLPSRGNWLSNIDGSAISFSGHLVAQTNVPNSAPLYAGSVTSSLLGLSGAAALTGNGQPRLVSIGSTIDTNGTVSAGNATGLSPSYTGVMTGLFLQRNNVNITALGGRFTARGSDGPINNLAIISGGANGRVSGLPSGIDANSTIMSMDTRETTLFVGGQVSGRFGDNNVRGFLIYDLANNVLAPSQPPALNGDAVVVNAVVVQPNSANVYVGGNFSQAGSLSCPSLCMYDSAGSQWMTPGTDLSGVVTAMTWASDTRLVLAGNLTAGGNITTMVNYDSRAQTFSSFPNANSLPGPVTALTPATGDYNQFWVAGTATSNNSVFLQKYDGQNWIPVGGLGPNSQVRSLQVISTTQDHAASTLVDRNEVLLLTGSINIPTFGNASAVLFNGTDFTPFLLTTTADNEQGTVGRIFVQNPGNFLSTSRRGLAVGFVVLIALAIALALIFLLVVAGILMERYRRRREGYAPIKQLSPDQQANLSRVPPERLFGTLGEKGAAPKI
ncbi:cortical protein marker for cell polarity-domain-containing protein [Elsinoe ampelina]|uniref:Cortical protein marker for cell polarity-domain-containing protein n=1 Tax=Elsinoe ampelina TaxID=302913 RepID=A0A6A6GGY1_9PEZI|nr:cortical protein marker for cell polarity-domain-containing protein [Elsinoe ampelina]